MSHREIDPARWRAHLREAGETLLGGDLDEAPMAYKPIVEGMAQHEALVDLLGRFLPKRVCMVGKGRFSPPDN
jgi:tRNA-splicing ligase RtcB